ncbi:MAG TPA: tetratricopeptide repeat protein [Pyrinomonadaceae bacterium]|jgi:tetratricopeptide (TPR) repeat protein|nr:tetratricopeptide repeat protein [Pyrinomonadaceae bacterium]
MGFDKAKAIRAAEKYLAQNKISSAIQEYCRIVEHDAEDFNAFNTLGDLYARIDKKQEALACFKRVAEHYRQQGFALKAIAVYKKITRLESATPEVANALALLYEQQGLLVDARAQYLQVADFYARDGQTREALEVLRRIANLDPNNIQIRLRLAESFLAEGLNDLAAEAFIEAGDRLLARNEHEKALDAYTKALTWQPHSHAALQGLISTHSALGTADEAAEVLERAAGTRPGDLELRVMLVNAYIEAENAQAAEVAVRQLASHDPSSFSFFFDVARLHLQQGNVNEAVRVLADIIETALSSRQEETLLPLLQEALARDPEQVEALRLLVRLYSWQRDDDNLRIALENLAETTETLGLEDEEREALTQLVRLAPLEFRYRERLEALGGAVETFDEQSSTEFSGATGNSGGGGDNNDEIPTFESFMLPDEPFALPAGEASAPASTTPETDAASQFEWNTVEPPAPAYQADASASFADLNDDLTNSAGASFEAPAAAEPPPAFVSPDAGAHASSALALELESVDFYLEQGYADIARDTLDMLERQYGPQPVLAERRQRLAAAAAHASPVETQEAPEAVEFEFQFDASAAAATPAATEPERAEINAPPEIVNAAGIENAFAFDDSPAPAATTVPSPATVASSSPVVAAQPDAPPTGIDPGLAAIFDEFREAVEEEQPLQDGDFETHYNMGLAYKEMDLLDQAVEEFQNAAGMVAPADGTPRYLHCCNLLGHCFMSKGVPRAAAIWFKKGLDAPGHTEDEYQALRFELGTAYEQMGDLSKAIDTFTEVYGIDVSYRGVSEKLRDLQAQQAAIKQ